MNSDYDPIKHDYLNWKEDWNRIPEWDDGTHHKDVWDSHIYTWYKNNKPHRERDKPAVIHGDSFIAWYLDGYYKRLNDKPNIIYYDGTRRWYDKFGRKAYRKYDRPCVINSDGYKEWRTLKNGVYFPIDSIKKSLEFYCTHDLLVKYMNNLMFRNLFTYDFQRLFCTLDPSFVSSIPSKYLHDDIKEEFSGHYELGNIGL